MQETRPGEFPYGRGHRQHRIRYSLSSSRRFVRPGAVRRGSREVNGVIRAVFRNPNGSKVLVAFHGIATRATFALQGASQSFPSHCQLMLKPRLPAAGGLPDHRQYPRQRMFSVEKNYDWSIKR